MKTSTLLASAVLLLGSLAAQVPTSPNQGQQPPAAEAPKAVAPKDGAPKDGAQEPAAKSSFGKEQLEQIVAPIALHPDTLLAQIMMASTYPLEIVEARRWVDKNKSLTGKALEEALKQQEWDPSVKSLCPLPAVLKQMDDNLDWTQDLGDAFLGQRKELMDAVQGMRQKALEAGNLKSSEQQKVSQDADVVVIESTKTEVVYVPTYYPTAVYGPTWSYPSYYYPPMYYPPPPGAMFFAFSVGVAWGACCWGGCNWHGGDVNINVNNFNQFNKNTSLRPEQHNLQDRGGGKQQWNHNAEHRKGVNYRDQATAKQFGGSSGSNRVTRDQARGYDRAGPSTSNRAAAGADRAGARPSTGDAGTRPTTGATGNRAADRSAAGSTGARPAAKPSGSSKGSALSGSRTPSADRSASARGAASRSSSGARSGGASRSGGGGRGGGGRW